MGPVIRTIKRELKWGRDNKASKAKKGNTEKSGKGRLAESDILGSGWKQEIKHRGRIKGTSTTTENVFNGLNWRLIIRGCPGGRKKNLELTGKYVNSSPRKKCAEVKKKRKKSDDPGESTPGRGSRIFNRQQIHGPPTHESTLKQKNLRWDTIKA